MNDKIEENALAEHINQKVLSCNVDLLAELPNLAPIDCGVIVLNAMGFQLTKKGYFGLAFPLSDGSCIDQLRNLSNGYLEFKDGTVKMGVVTLENLQAVLQAPYLQPGTVHLVTSAFT